MLTKLNPKELARINGGEKSRTVCLPFDRFTLNAGSIDTQPWQRLSETQRAYIIDYTADHLEKFFRHLLERKPELLVSDAQAAFRYARQCYDSESLQLLKQLGSVLANV